jgi:outer membrane protein
MRLTALATALAALLLAAPAAAELKIGFVDFRRALNEVEEGKAARASLKRDFDEKQKILAKEEADVKALQTEFEKQVAVLSDDAKRDKAMEIDRRMRDAQSKLMAFQKEISEREQEVTRTIGDKMESITREIAEAEGFTLVFERNNSGLIVGPASLDLTNQLVRRYNEQHKGNGEPAKKAGGEKKAEKKKADDKKPEDKKPTPAAK